jgi:N-acetylmuramoyl-L-alanine amidase
MKSMMMLLVMMILPMTATGQISGLAGWDICLDPGHSKTENMGIYGYSEAEKNVRVALQLREMLLGETDIDTVYMTRTNDQQSVGLSQRSQYANSVGATWFHSIHSDAGGTGSNSTLMLWGQYNTGLEKIPNGGNAMSDIMIEHLTNGMRTYTVYGSIGDCSFYGCGDWSGPYLSVNRNTLMPSELSEAGFHTNPTQNQLNMNDDWKRLEARTFYWSILDFHQIQHPIIRILTGIVTNIDNDVPVNGAEISVNGRIYVTDTYESLFYQYSEDPDLLHNGFYYFEDIEVDSVEVIVSAEGFYGDTAVAVMVDDFFTYKDFKLISSVPPYLTSTTPEDDSTGISILEDILIQFSRPMNKESVDSTLIISPDIHPVFIWRNNDQELVIRSDSLKFLTDYTITISGQSEDKFKHLFDGNHDGIGGDDFVLTFKTGEDYFAPVLENIYPSLNQKNMELKYGIKTDYKSCL